MVKDFNFKEKTRLRELLIKILNLMQNYNDDLYLTCLDTLGLIHLMDYPTLNSLMDLIFLFLNRIKI